MQIWCASEPWGSKGFLFVGQNSFGVEIKQVSLLAWGSPAGVQRVAWGKVAVRSSLCEVLAHVEAPSVLSMGALAHARVARLVRLQR